MIIDYKANVIQTQYNGKMLNMLRISPGEYKKDIEGFREASISESISGLTYNLKKSKGSILEPIWLGQILKNRKGVFVSPPRNPVNINIEFQAYLEGLLPQGSTDFYLGDGEFGFVSYELIQNGLQSFMDFAKSGLAKVLEHAELAEKFETIGSLMNNQEVKVEGFGPSRVLVRRGLVLTLYNSFKGKYLNVKAGRLCKEAYEFFLTDIRS